MEIQVIQIDDMPGNWQARLEVTRDLGTALLQKNESVLLKVPSAIVPETSNLLFGPTHSDATQFRIAGMLSYPFDVRLKR